MDVATLKAKIKSNQLPNYLIFTGDEWKVQQLYLEQIHKVTGMELKRVDNVLTVYNQFRSRSLTMTSVIYIVRDDKDLMTNEKLQQQIERGVLGTNMLIHLVTTVDKRTKFYKAYKDAIVEFGALEPVVLRKYIKKELPLSDKNCDILIEVCDHNYGHILLEIDKIKRYQSGGYLKLADDCFQKLLRDGTIHEPPYDAIFDLVDAILDRKVNVVFDLLGQAYEVGEATMVMLSVLYNNAKAVLQVQTYQGDSVAKGTGLTGWQIKNAKPHVGKYTDEDLVEMLRLIQRVESGIKMGTMEDEFAMSYLLTHIL